MNTAGTASAMSTMETPPPTAVEMAAAPPPQAIFWALVMRFATPPASLIGLKTRSRSLSRTRSSLTCGDERSGE